MIFISFAGENSELARALGLRMRAAGAEVWCSVFKDDLDDGHPWPDQIYAALDRCSVFVLLVTDAPLDGMTKEESDYARNLYNKHTRPRVVSVRLSESTALPKRYESLQSVVLPADWHSEANDFITKKLRQWGEIEAAAPAPAPAHTSPPPRSSESPASTTATPQSERTREAPPSRNTTTHRPDRTWLRRFTNMSLVASTVVLGWFGWELSGKLGGALEKPNEAKGPPKEDGDAPSGPIVYRTSSISTSGLLELVAIPAGRFIMGENDSDSDDERPEHEVILAAFELATTEVTRGLWREVLRIDPPQCGWSTDRTDDRLPANNVTWDEALEFCRVLSDREGFTGGSCYRLPSEAEWEYACRAGTGTKYWSGDAPDALDRAGWYSVNSSGRVQAVGEKLANPWGLFDVHGNVMEWCADNWHDSYKAAPNDGRAWGDETNSYRVLRGGSVENPAAGARSASRSFAPATIRWASVGFRPARSLTTD